MINKLKKKIFWIIQISFSIIILGVIIIFTSFSYKNTITSSTILMDRLEGKEEIKNDAPKEFDETTININPFILNIEGVYKLEIKNGKVIRESTDVTEEIREYALSVSNKIQEEGYIDNYIYKTRKVGNNEKEITLMENENAIKRLRITIISAVVTGLIGIFTIYLIARKVAKTIVKPVEESFEKQKQFVSDASHELKTPLAVIEANADVLQDKVGENKWITYIQNEVKSMDKLVNDLLILARIEKTISVNNQKFNLSKEVQMSVASFEGMMYEKEIKLETNVDENIYFDGNKEDIKRLIFIILDNAIKHTETEGKIVVTVKKGKNDIKIEIKNQGEPISEEEQEKIFERFYRIDEARNRNEKRYGLGLSIAKGIVDKYKGTIRANSKEGFTSFIIKLNLK